MTGNNQITILRSENYLTEDIDITIQREELSEPCFWHAHDFVEIVYVVSGYGTHKIEDDSYKVVRGDICVFNPYVCHTFVPDMNQKMEFINCIFRPRFLSQDLSGKSDFVNAVYQYILKENFEKIPCSYFHIEVQQLGEIDHLFESLYMEFRKKELGYLDVMKSDLLKLLLLLMRKKVGIVNVGYEDDFNEIMVKTALESLKTDYSKKIQISDMAKQFYVSEGYFSKKFKQYAGASPIQMLQKIRMEHVCYELKETERSITEIAVNAGYSDMKYFYNLFKRFYGKLPGEYRKENRIP